jgi:hypothetical protein
VVLLAVIGVGGWLLSHRNTSNPPVTHPSSSAHPVAADSVLTPVGATAFDNANKASLAIDHSTSTDWYTEYYFTSPYFGNLKKGTGLVLNTGRSVSLSRVDVLFGSNAGGDVQIKVSNSATQPTATDMTALPTVAQADDVVGNSDFTLKSPVSARWVVIWITKLPPRVGNPSQYQAEIYNVALRGSG